MRRLIIGISGASGIIYGIRLLEVLQGIEDIETHLVMSKAGQRTAALESDYSVEEIKAAADVVHNINDIAASISSGSFKTMGMIVAPCSMKTLSGIVHSYSDNLLLRAADVVLKDRRKLVILPRETPLHLGHIEMMSTLTMMGGIVMPPMPAFYDRPTTIDEIVNHTVNRVLDLYEIELSPDLFRRWETPK